MPTTPSKSTLPVYASTLIARMAQSVAPVHRPGIKLVYDEVMKVLRRHGAHAVVKVALAELWKEHKNHLGMVFKTPCSPRWFEGPSRGTIAS